MSSPALLLASVLVPLSDVRKGLAGDIQLVSDLTDADYYAASAADAEAGVATGFGFVLLWRADKFVAAQQDFLSSISGNTGYEAFTNGMTFSLSLGNGTAFNTISFTLYPSDISKLHVLGLSYDGANAVLFFNRRRVTSVACGFSPAGGVSMYYGRKNSAGFAAASHALGPLLAYRGAPTDAQMFALMDAFANGPIVPPKTMAGGTVTHVWSARKEFVGKTLTPWQVGPSLLADTVTPDKTSGLVRTGSPKYLPVPKNNYLPPLSIRGVQGFAAGMNLIATAAGVRGSATGFTLAFVLRLNAIPSASLEYIAGCHVIGGSTGWLAYTSGARLLFYTYAAAVDVWSYNLTAADIGRVLCLIVTWDAGGWRIYLDGAASGTSAAGFSPALAEKMWLGNRPDFINPAFDVAYFAAAGCDQSVTAAEAATIWQKFRSTGRLTLPTGKTNPHLWDFEQDYADGSGAVPSTFLDRLGADNLVRTGTLTRAQRVAGQIAMASYPLTWGLQGFTDAAYYSGSIGTDGGADNGKSFAVLLRITSQAVASNTRGLFHVARPGSTPFQLQLATTHSAIYVYMADSSNNAIATPVIPILAGDVGRLFLVVFQYDKAASRARAWARRAQVSSGTAMASFAANGTSTLYVGRQASAGTAADAGVDFLGAMSGDYTWTRGEIEQLFDDTEAFRELAFVPDKTSWRYRVPNAQPDPALGPPVALIDDISGAKPLAKVGTAMTISTVQTDLWTT